MLDAPDSGPQIDLEVIVQQVEAGDADAQELLYRLFEPGVRYLMARQLRSQEIEDKVHDTFVAVVTAIQAGQLRQPASLPAFVKTIAQRQVTGHISETIRRHLEPADVLWQQSADPERALIDRQQQEFAQRILKALPEIDRQILKRFYFEGQSAEQICQALQITETQFRLRKSRAKQRVAELTRQAMKRKKKGPGAEILLRKKAASGH